MTAEEPELELELEPDPGWYPVPEDEAEAAGWAEGLVRALAGPEAADTAVLATTESVLAHARAAYEAQVELAFVFLPQPLTPVVAYCHVELVFGTAGDLPDLDDIERAFSVQLPGHLSPPEVDRRLLVAGPAVRQHELRGADEDRSSSGCPTCWSSRASTMPYCASPRPGAHSLTVTRW